MSVGSLVWKIVWRIAFAAAVFVAITLVPSFFNSDTKDFEVTDANTRIELLDDAGLHITETLEFSYRGGTFTGAFRDIPLRNGARITNVEVSEGRRPYQPGGNTALGSIDTPGSFGVEQRPQFTRVVWHYDETADPKTFTLDYDVSGDVIAYDDTLDVGWTIWGDQWKFWLDDLSAEIVTPDGSDPTDAWVSSFPKGSDEGDRFLGADPVIGDGMAAVDTSRAKEAQNVVFRALVPRDAVSSVDAARFASGDGIAQVTADEEAISADQGFISKAENFVLDNAWLLFGLWTLLVVVASMLLAMMARERASSVPKYVPEPPEEIPPALAYALATEGEYDDRVVLATLLHLVDRGYYDTKASQDDALDLEMTVAANRPDSSGLESYEQEALKFFDDLLDGETVALSKLKDQIPEHSETWRARWAALTSALDQADDGKIEWDRDLTAARGLLAFVAFLGYAALGILYFTRTEWLAIPASTMVLGLLFIYLLPATAYKRLDTDGLERHRRWAGFKRWTNDFPRLDDDPPATLKLWRSILVYAVAFGTAEKVATSGRIPAPVGEEAANTGSWAAFAFYGGVWAPGFGDFSSGFSSQVAPESSSSGGGFSGGGGGFSGGGGGGAW